MVGSGLLACWGWFGPIGGCGCVPLWLEAWSGGGGPRTDANEPVCGLAHSITGSREDSKSLLVGTRVLIAE